MARVNSADVKAIIATESENLDVFILAAALIVNEDIDDGTLSEERLTELERYLAAHFVSLKIPQGRLQSLESDDMRQKFGGTYGSGLKFSPYGQMALQMDSTGTLADMQATEEQPPVTAEFAPLVDDDA